MEKLKSSLSNMVLVLVGFAVVIGAVLAWVNHITEDAIAAKAEKTLAEGIKEVMGTSQLQVKEPKTVNLTLEGKPAVFVIHEATDNSGKALGAAVESTTQGFGGDLKVLVGFNPDGRILGYTILQSSETPGLGMKAAQWFQKGGKGNIIGMSPKDGALTVKKDGGQVDAITASTITSRAFLKAVNQAYDVYAQNSVDAESGASKHEKE
ncbi:RnfABCDGE type electron transport complex subunit G [Prevotella sp. AGR2160]|uniref:RnfABCDGE type electron transport complex subunit G n=1 Tax=Prevotella sp. AGR2160 TaxID=1280674 RepID=UPI0004158261|nr:RnfABCDGE type electron transport complex subunit G [Prevotella sp. AGR2160]